ncbi:unnamed protein product [Caenorhabditis auriculariae]|uniref:Uncharacterized protein n=1 Tax=Caenorhabditis auriculariae TaxID=2777116 RepID=A0A8S1H0V6_9PELO|nr:unnamed protein product [Caenorhabditis auriculariae]
MFRAFLVLVLLPLVACQFGFPGNNGNSNSGSTILPCGFSCTARATLTTNVDNTFSQASCNDGNVASRCNGCCVARGLQAGISTTNSVGFQSLNGACVCCFSNSNKNCGNGGPVVFFTGGNNQK